MFLVFFPQFSFFGKSRFNFKRNTQRLSVLIQIYAVTTLIRVHRILAFVVKMFNEQAKNNSLSAVSKTYSCILPTFTYGALVWAQRFIPKLETTQTLFFKKYYNTKYFKKLDSLL